MKAKDKAEELINGYMNIFLSKVRNGVSGEVLDMMKEQASECALFVVNMKIEENTVGFESLANQVRCDADKEYWQQVKEEINEL